MYMSLPAHQPEEEEVTTEISGYARLRTSPGTLRS